jgi:hypothetical protein
MYDDLHKSLGKPENRLLPDESFLTSDLAQADEGLLELWKSDGWSRYSDGLFWTVDPREFSGLSNDWTVVPGDAIVFARNAFADLYFLSEGNTRLLDGQWGRILDLGPDPSVFLTFGLKPRNRGSLLREKLFKAVRKKLGTLEADECYGLFPALPLGGNDEDPAAYKRVKLQEYLRILAQSHA